MTHPTLPPMTREDALEAALAFIEKNKLLEPPLNTRGFPVDGWKPVNPHQRMQLILRTAEWLLGKDLESGGE